MMFDQIRFHYFFSSDTSMDSNAMPDDQRYLEFAKEHSSLFPRGTEFCLQGTSKALISRPCPEEIKKHVNYVQAFTYMEMGRSYYTRRGNMDSILLLYTYSGEGSLIYEGRTYQLLPGDLFIIDCRLQHAYQTVRAPWCHADLHVSGPFTEAYVHEMILKDSILFHLQEDLFQQQIEKILQLQTDSRTDWAFRVSCEIDQLLLIARDHASETLHRNLPETIDRARTYIEAHYTEDLSLDEIASHCNLSKYHLSREYKRYTGFSPKEYIIRLRIEQAKMLLSSTALPGYKVGILSGFQNEANFIRIFRASTGLTPGKWRKTKQYPSA